MPPGPARLCIAIAALFIAPAAIAQESLPAVSGVNGKMSVEGGVTGGDGQSSGIGVVQGSIATPLAHALGFQLDGLASTSYDTPIFGGTSHLFWRDPAIGLVGPVASVAGGDGYRLGWYGAEAEFYAGLFTFGAWGGYHEAVDNDLGLRVASAFYGGSAKVYPTPDFALSLGVTSSFQKATLSATLEYQPDLFARHNMSFFINGDRADDSYTVTAGIRLYFGTDKTLIRRHREDDPAEWLNATAAAAESAAAQATAAAAAYEAAFGGTVPPPAIAQNRALLANLVATNFLGQNNAAISALEAQYMNMWAH
jgi:hypothetical protein